MDLRIAASAARLAGLALAGSLLAVCVAQAESLRPFAEPAVPDLMLVSLSTPAESTIESAARTPALVAPATDATPFAVGEIPALISHVSLLAALPVEDVVASIAPPVVAAAADTAAAPVAVANPMQPIGQALAGLAAEAPAGLNAERKREREAVLAVYAARAFAPLWRDGDGWSSAAHAVLTRINDAAADGLDLRAYSRPALEADKKDAQANAEQVQQEIARQDIALSEAVVAYGRQASGSRVDPRRVGVTITAKPEIASAETILNAVAVAGVDAGSRLQAFNPPHAGYRALRDKLAELRRERAPVAQEKIPAGPLLKVGMSDPRVPLIRARLNLGGEAVQTPDAIVYDVRVADAVAGFQRQNGLKPSGQLTPRTIALLSGGEPSRLDDDIVSNMERWRWLPRDMGTNRIEVNIPEYALKVVHGTDVTHRARVVVGKPTSATPIFSNAMKFIIVNPSWYVPPSILKNEMLPKLAADPTYLQRLGYEMVTKRGQISIRQPPGERNALGRIKFMFPNDHAVYLHDTPSRGLFAATKRAFSHGCVRVDQPFSLAAAVLGQGYSEERLKKMVGGAERTVSLAAPLPIHLEYFTVSVDEEGRLRVFEDIYGYSHRLKGLMGLGA